MKPEPTPGAIAFVLPRPGRSWFGAGPAVPDGHELYVVDPTRGTATRTETPAWRTLPPTHRVVALAPTPHRLRATWAGALGLFGEDWVVDLDLSLRITDFLRFYGAIGKDLLVADQPITAAVLALQLQSQARTFLLDALTGIRPETLTTDLTPGWWEQKLSPFATRAGLALSVLAVQASSETKTASEQADRQQQAREELAARLLRQRQIEAETARQAADFSKQKAQIEHDASLSASARQHELAKLERQFLIERLHQEKEIRKLQAEIAQIDLAVQLATVEARRTQVAAEVAQLEARAKELEERVQAIPAETLQKAAQGKDNAACNDLHERFDVPHADLHALTNGPSLGSELVDVIAAQLQRQGDHPRLSLRSAVRTRDGRAKKSIDTVRIDSPLALSAVVGKAGFLSLVNLGSSGERVYLQVPNQRIQPQDCRTEGGATPFAVTDRRLMPLPRGYEFVENGPTGWERFILLRTDVLLWTAERLSALKKLDDSSFEFPAKSYEALVDHLQALPPTSWSAAVLGFDVID